MKAETNTDTGTCSDCGGPTLRLDTATGAVDCVDCGAEADGGREYLDAVTNGEEDWA